MSKLLNKVTLTLRCDSTFVDLMKTIRKFFGALQKVYTERFVATRPVEIENDMIGSDF